VIPVIAFCVFFGIGYYIWHGYKSRKVFFQNLLSFCNHILVEISFSKSTIRTIIDKYGQNYGSRFNGILSGYQEILDKRQDITRDKIVSLLKNTKLRANEQATITDFFYELGRHGATQEREKIENKKAMFDTFFNDAQAVFKKDASIYFKLFIILGLGAVILCL